MAPVSESHSFQRRTRGGGDACTLRQKNHWRIGTPWRPSAVSPRPSGVRPLDVFYLCKGTSLRLLMFHSVSLLKAGIRKSDCARYSTPHDQSQITTHRGHHNRFRSGRYPGTCFPGRRTPRGYQSGPRYIQRSQQIPPASGPTRAACCSTRASQSVIWPHRSGTLGKVSTRPIPQ